MTGRQRVVSSLTLWLLLSLVFAPVMAPGTTRAEEGTVFPHMQPDEETLEKWLDAYHNAPLTTSFAPVVRSAEDAPGGNLSLLSELEYDASERSQGNCGNCWAWAGTGCMELALGLQAGIRDRLSVQYINSCQYGVIGKPCCNGGWLQDVVDFYDVTDMCLPWSNPGAAWTSDTCSVPCGSITTDPHYDIVSISALTVPTHSNEGGYGDLEAVANIKQALDSGRGVWFAFFTSSSTAWNQFAGFWLNEPEDSVLDLDSLCSGTTRGPAHAVLCVGYNEDTRDEDYWLMLNSWGTAGGNRPNGTFRVEMDMDYDTSNAVQAFYWQTVDIEYSPPPPPLVTTDSSSLVGAQSARLHGTLVDDAGSECDCRFEYGMEGDAEVFATEWQSGIAAGSPFEADLTGLVPGTRYVFRAQAENFGGSTYAEDAAFLTRPLPPTEFSAMAHGESAADLQWTVGEGADRTVVRGKQGSMPSGPDDGYEVYDGAGTSCRDEGLDPAGTYWYAAWSVVDDETLGPLWSDYYTSGSATTIGGGLWMEGDVNLDARCDIVDALYIAQFTVGLRELNETQMLCADTTDDGTVNIVDAMHIAQFTVDPDMTGGILFKLLWESPPDEGLLEPLAA